MVDMGELARFVRDSHRHGYAASQGAVTRREPDRSTTIEHTAGDWTLHDNFFGGEPYGGRMVVFRRGRPLWMAVFYGWVEGADDEVTAIYAFLRRALLNAPEAFPVRGPETFMDGRLEYRNTHQGPLERFRGEEAILRDGRPAYVAWYAGGLVDRRGDA